MLTAAWFTTSMTLMDAVWAGNSEVLAMRLKEEGGQVDWTARRDGQTPLMHAIDLERPALVELLLSAGADANAANDNGWKPLHFAVANNYTAIVKLLLTRRSISGAYHTTVYYHAAADVEFEGEEVEGAAGESSESSESSEPFEPVYNQYVNEMHIWLHVNGKDDDGCTAGTCSRRTRRVLMMCTTAGAFYLPGGPRCIGLPTTGTRKSPSSCWRRGQR